MKSFGLRIVAAVLACCGAAWVAGAQDAPKPAYLDTSLSAEQRGGPGRPDDAGREGHPVSEPGPGHPTAERAGLRLVER
jgi:hypothetical protein